MADTRINIRRHLGSYQDRKKAEILFQELVRLGESKYHKENEKFVQVFYGISRCVRFSERDQASERMVNVFALNVEDIRNPEYFLYRLKETLSQLKSKRTRALVVVTLFEEELVSCARSPDKSSMRRVSANRPHYRDFWKTPRAYVPKTTRMSR